MALASAPLVPCVLIPLYALHPHLKPCKLSLRVVPMLNSLPFNKQIQDHLSWLDEVKLSQGLAASEPLERITRRPMRNMSESPGNCCLFFRHVASAESLHLRSADSFNPLSNETDSWQSSIQVTLAEAIFSQIAQTLLFQQSQKQ